MFPDVSPETFARIAERLAEISGVIRFCSPHLTSMPRSSTACPLASKQLLLLDTQRSLLCVRHNSEFSICLLVALAFLGWAIPTAANFVIEYNWWKEVAQVNTWMSMLWYSIAPAAVGALFAFVALYLAHARGLHFAGIRQRDYPIYSRLVPVGAGSYSAHVCVQLVIDFWTVMRFVGSRGLVAPPSDAWQDKVFSHALPFYLFDLPFYSDLLGFLFVLAILSARAVLDNRPWMAIVRTSPVWPADRWIARNHRTSGNTFGCRAPRASLSFACWR